MDDDNNVGRKISSIFLFILQLLSLFFTLFFTFTRCLYLNKGLLIYGDGELDFSLFGFFPYLRQGKG